MDTKNRLQFRYHNQVFDTREEAVEYVQSQIRFTEEGLAAEDPSYGFSLLAEPTILLYKNEDDETDPYLIIAIGSQTNEGTQYSDNRFCIIDIHKTESEIADLREELEKAIRSLTLIALSSDTLNFYAEKTDEGTYVSGDVKVAESHIFDDAKKKNNLMVTPEGLFIYVNLEYDPDNDQFTFTVSNADGTLTTTTVDLSDNYLVAGYYDKTDESIHLQMKDGEEIVVDCEDLIGEWGVEGDSSRTPVVLTREEVDYDHTDEHHHVEPWQDILRADIRIKDEEKILLPNGTYKYQKDPRSTNILDRTSDGRYLYVDGKASNIIYYMNGEKSTVKAALDELQRIKLSSDNDNILVEKIDGFFASTKLDYISSENVLVFKASGQEEKRIQLNTVELFEHIYYDPTKEALIVTYKDEKGETHFVEIPIGEMIRDWEWEPLNEGHNIRIVKKRNVSGNDKVSADAKIYDDPDNILVDKNHELFVKGTADNIKYGDGTVEDALDGLNVKIDNEISRATAAEQAIDIKLDQEIENRIADVDEEQARAEAAEQILDNKIGSGFTDDPHENVTYKFEQLKNKVDAEADKLQNEIDRSTTKDTEHDSKIEKIEDEIGDGFGPRNTVRDEIDNLQGEIDELSAQTASKLQDINSDNSINIDKTEPTIPFISVNLSEEVEHDKSNIIKLNNDGLYAGVDLSYEESANKLIFSTTNGSKEIQLDSMSSIISIEYNPSKEAIVITYMTNGHEIKTVEIPVGDLINEWRVEDGHPHAVQLEKVRVASGTSEQDVLKASVIINDDHEDNILIMDDGALYVPGAQISANTAAIEALEDRMDAAEDDIDALEGGLAAEIARATSAETSLNEKIDQEISDRISDVNRLETSITDEVNRATSEEQRIEGKLDSEISRSTTKDQELTDAIREETTRAISAETALQTAINNEVTRATSAEDALRTAINNEVTRATEKDAEHDEKIIELIDASADTTNLIHAEEDRARAAENAISHALDVEIINRENGDSTLDAKIENEKTRAQNAESHLNSTLLNEISRSTTADEAFQTALTNETTTARAAESALREALTQEISDRTVSDSNLQTQISNEIERAQGAEGTLDVKITNEKETREAEDARIWSKIRPIEFYDTTTIHNDRVRNTGENPDEVRHQVILAQAENNILLANDILGGLYATAKLGYNQSANLLTIYGPNDQIINSVTLGPGSIIKDISYDHTEKDLVVTYRRAGDDEDTIMKFPVADLFNEWDVQNPSEGSALELHKESQTTETGTVDIIWGRVLLTGAVERPDGTIDYGDNLIRIVNNGLYVSGSGVTKAEEDIECIKNELDITQENVLGFNIPACGLNADGTPYHYRGHIDSCVISAATSMDDADVLLDQAVCEIKEELECLTGETKSLENVIGVRGDCNEPIVYPKTQGCLLASATTFAEADAILEAALCSIKDNIILGEHTPTNEVRVEHDGLNTLIMADARLSHGNTRETWQTDEQLNIIDYQGSLIEKDKYEFTDTNVLRIVDLTETYGYQPQSKFNGLYLSNEWNCGKFYQEATEFEEIDEIKAQGFSDESIGYTDENPNAYGYNYMNNVRQNDPLG